MTPFKVILEDKTYFIEPQRNGTFSVIAEQEKIGTIYPTSGNLDIEWKTSDQLDDQFVSQMGELIADHQLSKSIL